MKNIVNGDCDIKHITETATDALFRFETGSVCQEIKSLIRNMVKQ